MMIPLRPLGRRGFTTQEPWVPLVIVVLLAVIALFALRRMGTESKVRIRVQRNLAALADSQANYRGTHGVFASRFGREFAQGVVRMAPDSGVILTISHADSAGWSASGTHPSLKGQRSVCTIWGGRAAPHDARLARPNEPRCL